MDFSFQIEIQASAFLLFCLFVRGFWPLFDRAVHWHAQKKLGAGDQGGGHAKLPTVSGL